MGPSVKYILAQTEPHVHFSAGGTHAIVLPELVFEIVLCNRLFDGFQIILQRRPTDEQRTGKAVGFYISARKEQLAYDERHAIFMSGGCFTCTSRRLFQKGFEGINVFYDEKIALAHERLNFCTFGTDCQIDQ